MTTVPLKLLHYPNDCHVKNRESILRMCKTMNIIYEATNDRERLQQADYTHLWLPMRWISPDELPKTIKILYGPHHSIFPEGALCGPRNEEWSKRCVYTTLSDWNLNVFKEFAPETVIPCVSLPFGLNPAIEDTAASPKTLDCFVYFKRRDPNQLKSITTLLNKKGLSYRLFSYGSYKNEDYMNTLRTVKFGVWIGSHESQGFAFQECLASNVPLLVWDVTSMMDEYGSYKEYVGKKHLFATTATQWSSVCGERVLREYELESALDNIQINLPMYTPRTFIFSKMSDSVCMKRILDSFSTTKTMAICYWGMTRSTRFVHETYQSNLYSVLKRAGIQYDVYMHTWKTENQIWGIPSTIPVDYEEYKLLEPTEYKLDNQDDFLSKLTFSDYFHESVYKERGDAIDGEWMPELLKNHLCALESQKRVTELCLSSGKHYDYVLYIRPDVRIDTPFPVRCLKQIQRGECCVTNFAEHEGYNDMFAVMRYEDCVKYGMRINEAKEFRKTHGRIVSEKYVKYILDKYFTKIHKIYFNFIMIRPNGKTPYVPQD